MQEEWLLSRDGEQLGPYSWEELVSFSGQGQLLPGDYLWHPLDQQWYPAEQFFTLPVGPEQLPAAPQDQGRPEGRKKRGCLGCLLLLLGMVIIFSLGAGLLLYNLGNRPSRMIDFGDGVAAARETIGPGGGTVMVEEADSPLAGFTITVPEGAYERETDFTVSYSPISDHRLGPAFNPVTPLISIDNGGGYADEILEVRIPVPLEPDRFTMAFYYDRQSGKLEGLPLTGAESDSITVATRHFSDLVATSISFDELKGTLNLDTGFRPGYDDWQFPNYGSFVAPRGHCAGQAISAMWYFYERRQKNNERPLYGRYDNNDRGYGTIDFWQDDSWGYRLSSAVQRDINWESLSFQAFERIPRENHSLTYFAFAYAMLLTGDPQFVGIRSTTSPGGHAIIAYRLTEDAIYVADPNYPGMERTIRYVDGQFLPYSSGDNAAAIAAGDEVAYDIFGYYAKTALVGWEQVTRRWGELDRGEVAADLFPEYRLEALVRENGANQWIPLVDGLTISTEETAAVELQQEDDMTGRLAIQAQPIRVNRYFEVFRGTDFLVRDRANKVPIFILDLEEGSNDLGFYVWVSEDDSSYYLDFQRYLVIYNEDDITGEWQGYYLIEEADRVLRFFEDMIVALLGPFFGGDEVREAFRQTVETPGIGREFLLAFVIEASDAASGDYLVHAALAGDDGTMLKETTRGTYHEGVLSFSIDYGDGTRLTFEGSLADPKRFSGTFSGIAWGIISDALSGRWQAEKVD